MTPPGCTPAPRGQRVSPQRGTLTGARPLTHRSPPPPPPGPAAGGPGQGSAAAVRPRPRGDRCRRYLPAPASRKAQEGLSSLLPSLPGFPRSRRGERGLRTPPRAEASPTGSGRRARDDGYLPDPSSRSAAAIFDTPDPRADFPIPRRLPPTHAPPRPVTDGQSLQSTREIAGLRRLIGGGQATRGGPHGAAARDIPAAAGESEAL